MHGIVSLLDEVHTRIVSNMWRELEKDFGVRQLGQLVPFPHFSYQIAHYYEEEQLVANLEHLARDLTSFTVSAGGLSLFTGPHPVLFVPLVRTQALSEVHQALWSTVNSTAEVSPYYQDEAWMPHITLAEHDVTRDKLADIISAFSTRILSWKIHIDNIAVIWDTGTQHEVRYRFALRSS